MDGIETLSKMKISSAAGRSQFAEGGAVLHPRLSDSILSQTHWRIDEEPRKDREGARPSGVPLRGRPCRRSRDPRSGRREGGSRPQESLRRQRADAPGPRSLPRRIDTVRPSRRIPRHTLQRFLRVHGDADRSRLRIRAGAREDGDLSDSGRHEGASRRHRGRCSGSPRDWSRLVPGPAGGHAAYGRRGGADARGRSHRGLRGHGEAPSRSHSPRGFPQQVPPRPFHPLPASCDSGRVPALCLLLHEEERAGRLRAPYPRQARGGAPPCGRIRGNRPPAGGDREIGERVGGDDPHGRLRRDQIPERDRRRPSGRQT